MSVTTGRRRPPESFAKEPPIAGGGSPVVASPPHALLLDRWVLAGAGDAGCGCGDQLTGRARGGR